MDRISKSKMVVNRCSARIFQGISWPFGRLLLNFFGRLTVRGAHNVKKTAELQKKHGRGVLIVSNHLSELDPVLVLAALHPLSPLEPMFYVARRGKRYTTKKFGWRRYIYGNTLFKLYGALPINDDRKNYSESLETHIRLLNEGETVCIFPEGGIRLDTNRRKIHGGVGYLASVTDPIILPVKIANVEELTLAKFIRRDSKLIISYGEPFRIADLNSEPIGDINLYQHYANQIMDMVSDLT